MVRDPITTGFGRDELEDRLHDESLHGHPGPIETAMIVAQIETDRLRAALARVKSWAEDPEAGRWFDSDYQEARRHALDAIEGRNIR